MSAPRRSRSINTGGASVWPMFTRASQGVPARAGARGAAMLLAGLLCLAPALAGAFQYQWDIRAMAAANADIIALHDKRKKIIARVSTQQMRVLYAVKTAIEQVAEMQVEFILVDGKEPNAFAGKAQGDTNVIGINLAMLEMVGMDVHAMAALIGHEIAHLKLHHPDEGEKRAAGTGIARVLGGVVLGTLGVPGSYLLSDLAVTAIETKYSRDDERQADYLGAIWAVEAGFEVDGAVRLHTAIYESAKGRGTPFLSTHPSGPERITTLKGLAKRLGRNS